MQIKCFLQIIILLILVFLGSCTFSSREENLRKETPINDSVFVENIEKGSKLMPSGKHTLEKDNQVLNDELSTLAYSNICEKCDIDLSVQLLQSTKEIEILKLDSFLCTYSIDCSLNIEFSQLYSEVIFLLLNNHPLQVLSRLNLMEKENALVIIRLLENPVDDTVDIDYLIKIIEETTSNNSLKEEVLRALKIANSKY